MQYTAEVRFTQWREASGEARGEARRVRETRGDVTGEARRVRDQGRDQRRGQGRDQWRGWTVYMTR